MSVGARVKDLSVAELVDILLHAHCCVEVAFWLQVVVCNRHRFDLIVASCRSLELLVVLSILILNRIPYSVGCRSGRTAAIVHGDTPFILLLLCTPLVKRLVDLVSQVLVGGQGGIELLLANRVGIGLRLSWVLCVDQPAVNPEMFQATWALRRLGSVAILVLLLRLRNVELRCH